MKNLALAIVLGVASNLCAQTTTPESPTPQQQEKPASETSRASRFPMLYPSLNATHPGKISPGRKFQLFVFNTVNPYPIAVAAATAGITQATDSYPGYGQGAEGFGKRFGAAYADNASLQFFGTYLFPVVLRQDPRYFRKETGGFSSRIGYAATRVLITPTDSGRNAPNISFWMGAASSAAISNLYYPAGSRSFNDGAYRFGIDFATQVGFNVAKEFWPDVKHKVFGKK